MPPEHSDTAARRADVLRRIAAAGASGDPAGHLLAVSKTQPPAALQALHDAGQRAFGENYVQEAMAKQAALGGLDIEWHLIGPLQSNKAALAARHFDWVQSVDRAKLVTMLAKAREPGRGPLNVLLQVNIDDEASKSGCRPDEIAALADAVMSEPALRLRGLMAIPAPWPEEARRIEAFEKMHRLFARLRDERPGIDTLSMGMSHDYRDAILEGATHLRIGTAITGNRPTPG